MEGGNIFEPVIPPQQNPPLANQPLRPRTLGEYSRPSHQGYRNTIELTQGANVFPLRFDTIRLVQSGCAFHGLRSEDPNQHLKDFLKIVDSIDLDVATRETTRLRLFQFSLRDQADPSPHGMISPLISLLNFSHRGELLSLEMTS